MNRLVDTEIVSRFGIAGGPHIILYFERGGPKVLPLPQLQYPVIVTSTQTHVLWVAANDQAEAVNMVDRHYDLDAQLECDDTRVSDRLEVEPPGVWGWSTVTQTSGHGYPGTPYDEHVREHGRFLRDQERIAKQAACAATGHTDRRQWIGLVTCNLCLAVVERDEFLPPTALPAPASAVSDQ